MILAKTYKEGYPDKIRQRPLILWKINTHINSQEKEKTDNSFFIAKNVLKQNQQQTGIIQNAKIAKMAKRKKEDLLLILKYDTMY